MNKVAGLGSGFYLRPGSWVAHYVHGHSVKYAVKP